MARLASQGGGGAWALARDVAEVLTKSDLDNPGIFRLWEDFIRTRVHILSRGDLYWGADKILLQLRNGAR